MNDIIVPVNLLIETPLSQLYNNTMSSFDTPRQQTAGRVQVIQKIFIPAPNNGMVEVAAKTRSSAKMYQTRMRFDDIQFVEAEEGGGRNTTFTASDGQEYTIEPVSYGNNDVKVSCGCLDFYYRFSVWNDRDGSLYGNPPPPYVKKTDKEPVNPSQTPGLCKHLIALTNELRQERFLV